MADENDYSKVKFLQVDKFYTTTEDLECKFEFVGDICATPEDSIYIIRVDFASTTECVTFQKIKDTVSKSQTITFNAENLPQGQKDFYQFLYVSGQGSILGASTAFLLQTGDEDLLSLDEDYLIITPQESQNTSSTAYQKLLVKARRIEDENESLKTQLLEATEQVEKLKMNHKKSINEKHKEFQLLIKEQTEQAVAAVDNYKNEIQKLTADNNELKNKLKTTNEENTRIENLQYSLQKENSELKRAVKVHDMIANKQMDVNQLLDQLSQYEMMVKALEGTKSMCLKEINIQKMVKQELQKLVDQLTADKEMLIERINELQTPESSICSHDNVSLCSFDTLSLT